MARPKGIPAWNKGMKGRCFNTGRTHFKKGIHPKNLDKLIAFAKSPQGRERMRLLRLGGTPWNKGKKCPQLMGESNHLWKGGNSKHYKTGYYSFEYKQWRLLVFERDGYQCQGCANVGGYLTAHHIKSFAKFPKLRFGVSNGITLCEECHKVKPKIREEIK